MKTILFKAFYTFLIIPGLLMAGNGNWKGKHTKEKKISKQYSVNEDALLKVNNSYGQVYVTTWAQNTISIEVHIKTNGNNEKKVQARLDKIDVEFEASQSLVSARTRFGTSGWGWGKNNNVSIEVNYTIKTPATSSVDLNNDYGSISIDKLYGRADISCDYGKLDIGELHATDNKLSFDYTSNSTIDYMKGGQINADYSGFELDKAGNITIKADYTESRVGDMENLSFSCDYGSLKVDKANNIDGNGDYLTTRFGTVSGNLDFGADYGSLKIDTMAANAGSMNVRCDYTSIKVGYEEGYHFDFVIKLDYAGLDGGGDFEYKIKRIESHSKYFEGYHGASGSGNKVNITADYGGVTFRKN